MSGDAKLSKLTVDECEQIGRTHFDELEMKPWLLIKMARASEQEIVHIMEVAAQEPPNYEVLAATHTIAWGMLANNDRFSWLRESLFGVSSEEEYGNTRKESGFLLQTIMRTTNRAAEHRQSQSD